MAGELGKLWVVLGADIGDLTRKMATAGASVDAVASKANQAPAGINKLNGAFRALGTQISGVSPVVGQLGDALGSFAIGAGPMLGILAGFAALAFAYQELTKESRKAAAAVKESTDELEKLVKLQRQGLVGHLTPGIVEAENQVQELATELRALADAPAFIRALPWNAARMKELIGLIGEQNLKITTGEKQITELVTGEINKQADARAAAAKKREDSSKKFFEAEKKRLEDLRVAAAAVAVRMSQLGTGQLLAKSGVGPVKSVGATGAGGRLAGEGAIMGGGGAAAGGGFLSDVKGQIGAMVSQFGPLAAVAAALAPVFQGIKDAIGPAMEALAVPLRAVGMLIGSTIAPVLKLLAPPLRLLAIAASYVNEALGRLIKGIGDFLNKILPGNPFKFLVNYGNEMIEGAKAARASLDGAAEGADKLADSLGRLNNAPGGFKVDRARFNASQPLAGAGGVNVAGDLVVMSNDPKAVLAEIEKEAQRKAARGGTGLTLGYA